LRIWVLLLGLAAVLAALALAGAEAVITEQAHYANAKLAGGVFSIPLAAVIRL
jgi:hypothetical protein